MQFLALGAPGLKTGEARPRTSGRPFPAALPRVPVGAWTLRAPPRALPPRRLPPLARAVGGLRAETSGPGRRNGTAADEPRPGAAAGVSAPGPTRAREAVTSSGPRGTTTTAAPRRRPTLGTPRRPSRPACAETRRGAGRRSVTTAG